MNDNSRQSDSLFLVLAIVFGAIAVATFKLLMHFSLEPSCSLIAP